MFAKGYRPDGANQHIAVVKFVEFFVDSNDAIIFDRMRRKRHSSVYDTAGSISKPKRSRRSVMQNALSGRSKRFFRNDVKSGIAAGTGPANAKRCENPQ